LANKKLVGAITTLLNEIGEDGGRGGLLETPERAAKAWYDWTKGYAIEPLSLLKTFDDGASNYDAMVLVKDIPFYSHCEHHLAPIIGRATIGYIPDRRIVGLSKLNRVVDAYARRLQVQERLTTDIAECVNVGLKPIGVGVYIRARHMCMESRGVCQQGHTTVTQCLLGAMRNEAVARAEFLELAKSDTPI
jgi:GTP cyclohydrolase I